MPLIDPYNPHAYGTLDYHLCALRNARADMQEALAYSDTFAYEQARQASIFARDDARSLGATDEDIYHHPAPSPLPSSPIGA